MDQLGGQQLVQNEQTLQLLWSRPAAYKVYTTSILLNTISTCCKHQLYGRDSVVKVQLQPYSLAVDSRIRVQNGKW